jgi:hypothetical protein
MSGPNMSAVWRRLANIQMRVGALIVRALAFIVRDAKRQPAVSHVSLDQEKSLLRYISGRKMGTAR